MSEFVSLLGLINYGFVLFFGIVMSLYLADIHFEDNKIPYIITILALGAIQLLSYLMMGENLLYKCYPLLIHLPLVLLIRFAFHRNIYIATTVKCRPPQNRDPLPEEQEACSAWLDSQIALMHPKIIVCVGRISAQRYISKDFRVTKEHGLFYNRDGILYMGTFHPAALLRNPNQKPAAFEDFIALRDKINEICDHTY